MINDKGLGMIQVKNVHLVKWKFNLSNIREKEHVQWQIKYEN